MSAFLSIVTRHMTSRPRMFARQQASLQVQTDQDFEQVLIEDPIGHGLAWANAQFAVHAEGVHGAYVLALDDDDLLAEPTAIAQLKQVAHTTQADIIMFRVRRANLDVLPDNANWGGPPVAGHISGQCCIVRREVWQRHAAAWDQPRGADYAFLTELWQHGYQVAWHNQLLVRMQRIGHGQPETADLLRLNIGCGQYPLADYVNIDADLTTPADVHADAYAYLATYADGSVAEIYAGHFLEHLDKPDADRFLAECFRVLQPGGICALVVPDIREVMKRYIGHSLDAEPLNGRFWSLNDLDDICGWFLYSTTQASVHRWSYDEFTLRRVMQAVGFDVTRRIDRYRDPRLGAPAWFQCGWEGIKPCG